MINLTEGDLLMYVLARPGIEPTTVDLSSQTGAFDHSATPTSKLSPIIDVYSPCGILVLNIITMH